MSTESSGPPVPPAPRPALWFAVDLLCVLLFALVGMATHDSPLSGFLGTAWPFTVGLLLAWFVPAVRALPLLVWPTGVLVWASTTIAGLVLRAVSGGGLSGAFPWVTAGVLALLLIGWRLGVTLLRRGRSS